jgi:hypothetical protein
MQYVRYTHGSFQSYTDVDVRAVEEKPKFTAWPDKVGERLAKGIASSYQTLQNAEAEFIDYTYELSQSGAFNNQNVQYKSQSDAIRANCVGDL